MDIRIYLNTIVKHICLANGCRSGEITHDVECGKFRIYYDGQRWFGEAPNKWGGDINSMFGGDNFQCYLRIDYKPNDAKIYDTHTRVLIKERTNGVFNKTYLLNKLIEGLYKESDDIVINGFFTKDV